MAKKALREYSQDYINEMAENRELSLRQIGVSMAAIKRKILGSGKNVKFDYTQIEDMFGDIKEETLKVVDQELTQITIKTLSRFRQLISGQSILDKDEIVSNLRQQNKKLEDRVQQLKNDINEIKILVDDKDRQLSELMAEYTNQKISIDETQKEVAHLKKLQEDYKNNLSKLRATVSEYEQELDLKEKKIKKQQADIDSKSHLIEQLKDESKSAAENITEALATMEAQFEEQAEFFEEEKKQAVDKAVEKALREQQEQYESQLENIQNKVKEEQAEKQRLQHTVMQKDSRIKELQKDRKELREEFKEIKERMNKIEGNKDYFLELLSNSNLASINILMELGGSMNIDSLAKSVGMQKDYVKQLYEKLAVKNLVKITEDGKVILTPENLKKDEDKFVTNL